jgi:hypothetical protein
MSTGELRPMGSVIQPVCTKAVEGAVVPTTGSESRSAAITLKVDDPIDTAA